MTLAQQISKIVDDKLRALKLDSKKNTSISGDNWNDGTQKVKVINGLTGTVTIAAGSNISVAIDGQNIVITGTPAENGVPPGGTTNQLLAKNSDADYDMKFVDAPEAANGLPAGGTNGQVLAKVDSTNFNVTWVNPPSGGNPIDMPPSNPNELNDEFYGSVLDSKWLWMNQGAATASVQDGYLKFNFPSAGVVVRGLVQPVPSSMDFTCVISIPEITFVANYTKYGILISESLTGKQMGLWIAYDNGPKFMGEFFNTPSSRNTFSYYGTAPNSTGYLKMRFYYTSAWYVDCYYSRGGRIWTLQKSAISLGFIPAYVGIGSTNENASSQDVTFDWFRIIEN